MPKRRTWVGLRNLSGNPMSNRNLLQWGFYPALRRAGLRQIRFHDLRDTFASLMIANGEDIVRVSRLLGHASPAITLKIYSHAMPRGHYGSPDRLSDLGVRSDGRSPRDDIHQVTDGHCTARQNWGSYLHSGVRFAQVVQLGHWARHMRPKRSDEIVEKLVLSRVVPASRISCMVARGRIELPTRGFTDNYLNR